MSQVWSQQVRLYLDQLQTATETIDLLLDDMQLSTQRNETEQVSQVTKNLEEAIEDLSQLIQQREQLLHSDQAPVHGLTLVDKLFSTHHIDDARLARRCQKISSAVENSHQRAVSLFVCHYHLTELSQDLVRIFSGERYPATYGKHQPIHRGGLFSESA